MKGAFKVQEHFQWNTILFLLVLLPSTLLLIPRLYGFLLADEGQIELLKASPCDPEWFVCVATPRAYPPLQWDGNAELIQRASKRLQSAVRWNPGQARIYFGLAAALFSLGERDEATVMLGQAEALGGDSLIFQDGRYEYHLLKGRLYANSVDWLQAVQNYRLGLALGAERTLPVDEQDFFLALAAFYQEQAVEYSDDGLTHYLAGKYLVRAKQWNEAIVWLHQALTSGQIEGLGVEEQSRAHIYLGLAFENIGDPGSAREAYEKAIEVDPDLAEGYVRLLTLLRQGNDEAATKIVEERLALLEPPYILGQQSDEYVMGTPKEFADGWTLLGYAVDDESLEAGPPLDLLLWWENPASGRQPKGENWVQVGEHRWFQWQHVINLAPNAGLEWGVQEGGLPLGFMREVYEPYAGSISIQPRSNDAGGHALLMDNALSKRVGIESFSVPVSPFGMYLMAGWKWDDAGGGSIGRQCEGVDFPKAPYYITDRKPESAKWIHFADVNNPRPGKAADKCSIFLLNYEVDGKVLFDNIIFARISLENCGDSKAEYLCDWYIE